TRLGSSSSPTYPVGAVPPPSPPGNPPGKPEPRLGRPAPAPPIGKPPNPRGAMVMPPEPAPAPPVGGLTLPGKPSGTLPPASWPGAVGAPLDGLGGGIPRT